MMDDPVYCDRAIKKLHDYQMNGFSISPTMVMNLNQMKFFFGVVIAVLLTSLLILLIRKMLVAEATCLGISMIAISIWFVPVSLEYVWMFILMLVTSIVTVMLGVREKEKYIPMLLFLTGMCAAYFDFFTTGDYDKNRDFILTTSPSMDILVSSNLERLIYKIAGNDAIKNKELMDELNSNGKYTITAEMKAQLNDFYGNYATEKETADTIKELYDKTGYVIDTHTAVAATVCDKFKKDVNDGNKTVVVSTASPFKFSRSVLDAIDPKYDALDDFAMSDELEKVANVKTPKAIEDIKNAPVLHDLVINPEDMKKAVVDFLSK